MLFDRKGQGGICMENNIVKEIIKDLSWIERIVVVLFKKIFLKVYKKGITFGFNNKQNVRIVIKLLLTTKFLVKRKKTYKRA